MNVSQHSWKGGKPLYKNKKNSFPKRRKEECLENLKLEAKVRELTSVQIWVWWNNFFESSVCFEFLGYIFSSKITDFDLDCISRFQLMEKKRNNLIWWSFEIIKFQSKNRFSSFFYINQASLLLRKFLLSKISFKLSYDQLPQALWVSLMIWTESEGVVIPLVLRTFVKLKVSA